MQKFSLAEASFERTPRQGGYVFMANLIDERQGGAITVAYGLYQANQGVTETAVLNDVMIVLEGRLTITSTDGTATAGPGEILYMPKNQAVELRAHEQGALTAAVTYPDWMAAQPASPGPSR